MRKNTLRLTPPAEIIEMEEAIRDQHSFMFKDVRAFLGREPSVYEAESTPGRNRFFNGRASQATVNGRGVWDWVNTVLDQSVCYSGLCDTVIQIKSCHSFSGFDMMCITGGDSCCRSWKQHKQQRGVKRIILILSSLSRPKTSRTVSHFHADMDFLWDNPED